MKKLILILALATISCSKPKDDECKKCVGKSQYMDMGTYNSCEGLPAVDRFGSPVNWDCE